jgi:hypothetical protein
MRSACCERHNTKRNPVNPDIHMELWTFGEQNRNGWSLGGYARIERCAILSLQRVLRPTGFRGLASQVKRHGNAKGTKGWTANPFIMEESKQDGNTVLGGARGCIALPSSVHRVHCKLLQRVQRVPLES